MDFLKSAVSQFGGSDNRSQGSQQSNAGNSDLLNEVENFATQADPNLKPYENMANEFLGGGGGSNNNNPTTTSSTNQTDALSSQGGYDQQSSQPLKSSFGNDSGGGAFNNQRSSYGQDHQSTYNQRSNTDGQGFQVNSQNPGNGSGYNQDSTYGKGSDSYDNSADTDSTYQQPSSKTSAGSESYDDSSYDQNPAASGRGDGSAGYGGQFDNSRY